MNVNFPKDVIVEKELRSAFVQHWLRRIFIDDWLLKLTAVAISFALWLGVSGLQTTTSETVRHVPLQPRVANELQITNSPREEVELSLAGEKRKLDSIDQGKLRVSLDLTDVKEGDHVVSLTPENITVDLPSGVRVNEIVPDKLSIKLERVEEREILIRAEIEGNPANGYEVYSTKIIPEKVRVRGPKSSVESLNFVSTGKIDVDGQKANFREQQVSLSIIDPNVTLVDAVSANIFFRIGKKRIERLFVVSYETDTRSGKASVLLYGPAAVLEDLNPEELQITEERNETRTIRLGVILPAGLKDEVEVKSVKFRE